MGKESFSAKQEWKKIGLSDKKQEARTKYYEKLAKFKKAMGLDLRNANMKELTIPQDSDYLFGALRKGLGKSQPAYRALSILTTKGFNVDKIAEGTKVKIENGYFILTPPRGEVVKIYLGEEEEPAPTAEKPAPAPEEPAPVAEKPEEENQELKKEEEYQKKLQTELKKAQEDLANYKESLSDEGRALKEIPKIWERINKSRYTREENGNSGTRLGNPQDDNEMMDMLLKTIVGMKPKFSKKYTDFILPIKYYKIQGSGENQKTVESNTRGGGDTLVIPERATLRITNNGNGTYKMDVRWTGSSWEQGKKAPFYKEKFSEYKLD
ncbi:hypothetical protein KJ632_03055 [Patescibacteria group bacterium]|nr:hypothetical protein [Patescibacteria group bacterium]